MTFAMTQAHPNFASHAMTAIHEPAVVATDVLVVGGGPAGVAAALAAARGGTRTVLVERHGFCGGMGTAAGVSVFINYRDAGKDLSDSIYREIIDALDAEQAHYRTENGHCDIFEPEALKAVLDHKLTEAGVELFTGFCPVGIGRVNEELLDAISWRIDCAGKTTRQLFLARCLIDATGDADVCALAGVPTKRGRVGDGRTQPMTMIVRLGGFDIEAWRRGGGETTPGGHALEGGSRRAEIVIARQRGEWSIPRDDIAMFWTHPWDRTQVSINATRIIASSSPTAADHYQAEREGRRQAWELWRFLKKYVPGFAHSFLVCTGPQIGVRETRRVVGVETLGTKSVLNRYAPEDSIAFCSYPIDIHSPDGREGDTFDPARPNCYGIPYGCLVPDPAGAGTPDWLLVAGRCISASHEAAASFRVMPACFSLGQAAGTAAALAVRSKRPPRLLNGADVRRVMDSSLPGDHRAFFPSSQKPN